jgi:hypothetical protein
VVELKASDSEVDSGSESNPEGGKWIIDAKPGAIVATTKFRPSELEEPEEGERLFHSQMWVKGALLHFIVNSTSQNNLISAEVIKRLDLQRHRTHNPTPSVGFTKDEISVSYNSVICPTTSSRSKMRYCVILLPLKFVMFF